MMLRPQLHLTRGGLGCALAARTAAVAIVVDALRASTTIATLFDHGLARLLVIADVDDARALAAEMPDATLIGERGGERLPGFHLGNSPLEVLASPRMDGQIGIFTSSNGAQRLTACTGADHTLVGSVCNATAIATWVRPYVERVERDVVCIAAGKHPDEQFISPEDEATCTYLAWRIGLPITESCCAFAEPWERALILDGLETIFRSSRHAQRLMEIGYAEDVFYCARPDTVAAVPAVVAPVMYRGQRIGVEVVNLRSLQA